MSIGEGGWAADLTMTHKRPKKVPHEKPMKKKKKKKEEEEEKKKKKNWTESYITFPSS